MSSEAVDEGEEDALSADAVGEEDAPTEADGEDDGSADSDGAALADADGEAGADVGAGVAAPADGVLLVPLTEPGARAGEYVPDGDGVTEGVGVPETAALEGDALGVRVG